MRIAVPVLAVLLLAVSGCVSTGPGAATEGCPAQTFLVEQEVVVGNLAGGGRVGPGDSQDVPVEAGDAVPWACVRSVTATLRWTNTPTSGADLYLGLEAPAAGVSALGHDRQQVAADGAHEETVAAAVPASSAAALASGLAVVIRSDWASLSGGGIPARLTVGFGMA